MSEIQVVSTEEVKKRMEDRNTKIIDVRPVDAYNGWKLRAEKRGGHIKNAKSLPLKWIHYIDWGEIVDAKGLKPQNNIIIYGYEAADAEKVAKQFISLGYDKVQIYNDFLTDWTTHHDLPMESLARYKNLVPASWLNALINTGRAPEYDNTKFVLCHCHYINPDDYYDGHIPKAISVDTNTLESTETWNRRSPEELKAALENLGISHDTTVIVYGRFSSPDNNDPFPGSSSGHLGAFRTAVIMMYAGVKDVRVLNGGLQAWLDAGYETTQSETSSVPINDFGIEIPGNAEIVIDTPEAKEYLADANKNLVSIRSWREFIGEVSGYNYIEKKGRIPGAVFGNCGSDPYHMENFRNLDHTTREYHEIEEKLHKVGVTPDKQNAFYCGTGWRGSEAFFNAWLMGWPDICLYDGGWFEWSNDPSNPFKVGVPE